MVIEEISRIQREKIAAGSKALMKSRAKVFVWDISGVSAMDTEVSNQLIKITEATQLMGCETMILWLN